MILTSHNSRWFFYTFNKNARENIFIACFRITFRDFHVRSIIISVYFFSFYRILIFLRFIITCSFVVNNYLLSRFFLIGIWHPQTFVYYTILDRNYLSYGEMWRSRAFGEMILARYKNSRDLSRACAVCALLELF